jgi:hypothetical protein
MKTLDDYHEDPRYEIPLSAYELRAIIRAVNKDRDYSPEPNPMRPTERDDLLGRLRRALTVMESIYDEREN